MPLVVVQQAPMEVSSHVGTGLNALGEFFQIARQKIDSLHVMHLAVPIDFVGAG